MARKFLWVNPSRAKTQDHALSRAWSWGRRVVIADGVGTLWCPDLFAKLVCAETLDRTWLRMNSIQAAATRSWKKKAKPREHSHKPFFDRGSAATVLALTVNTKHKRFRFHGIGDCAAVILFPSGAVTKFPYQSAADMPRRPRACTTAGLWNTWEHRFSGYAPAGTQFLLMTDSLAAGCLALEARAGAKIWHKLAAIDKDTFPTLCSIVSDVLGKTDDMTLIRETVPC